MDDTAMSTTLSPPPLPPPRALSSSPSLLTQPLPSTTALSSPPPLSPPIPSHVASSSPLTTSPPPPSMVLVEAIGADGAASPSDDSDLDSDRVQVWLAQQSQLDIHFRQAEGVHMFEGRGEAVAHDQEEGEEEVAFGAEEYVGYAGYGVGGEKGLKQENETGEGEDVGVGEVVHRLGLGLSGGHFGEEGWKEEEGRRIPDATPNSRSRSPESLTESSSRVDSPVLGFPSSESLLLPLPPALNRGLSGSLSRKRSSGGADAGHTADGYTGLVDAHSSGEDVGSAVADPLRRPGRHYVRVLPEGASEEEVVATREGRYTLHVDEEAYAYEAAYAYVDAGGVVVDGFGRDKPLPTLPPPSPSASPPPDVEVLASASAPGLEAAVDSAAQLQQQQLGLQSEIQPQPPSLKRSQTHSRSHSRSQSRRNSSAAAQADPSIQTTTAIAYTHIQSHAHAHSLSQSSLTNLNANARAHGQAYYPQLGVSTSARHAQFSIGPGPGPAARRASQSTLLGGAAGSGGVGGGGTTSVPLSRRPSLLRMPSLPLLGESAEPPAVDAAAVGASVEVEVVDALPEPLEMGVEVAYEPQPVQQPQYHLPLGMQVRRARSAMLLASTSISPTSASASGETSPSPSPAAELAGVVSLSSSLSSLSLLQPSPTQASVYPAQQQQQVQLSPSASASSFVQSSPLPPSAPPTRRSRAGSLGAAMSLSPYNYQGQQGLHSHAPSMENISTSGIRDAVYIDSAEVRARLDRLLAGLEVEGVDGLGGDEEAPREDVLDEPSADELVHEGEEEEEAEMGEDELERADDTLTSFGPIAVDDDVDPDAANALRTPPSAVRAEKYRRPTVSSRAPPNTPMTPSYVPSYGLSQQQQQSPHLQEEPHKAPQPHQHKAQRSHASLHSVRSAGSRGSSLGSHAGSAHGSRGGSLSVSLSSSGSLKRQQHPYQHAQASASQVYVGPGLAVTGGHVRTASTQQQQQQHARGASGGSSSRRHSRAPSQGQGQGHAQQQSQSRSRASSVAHSRAASLSRSASMQPLASGQSHSRTSSAAHSRTGSVVLLVQQPPTPPMLIPVPVPVPGRAAVPSARPTRPPPAPPLDVAALEVGLRRVSVVPELDLAERGDEVGDVEVGVDADVEVMVVDLEGSREEEEEEEETSEDERERLQFLRGLGLEDRMKEFEGVEFPSSLDDDGAELGAERDRLAHDNVQHHDGENFGAEQSEFLASHRELINEGMLVVASDDPGDHFPFPAPPAMQRSMSRWSLGSSTMDEPVEETSAGTGKKERKRKSFASPFGLGGGSSGDAVDGGTLSASAGTSSPTGTGGGKEKKRGRLASFISRLSGVGINGTLPSTPTSPPPPPLPTSPTSPTAPPGLLPSPLIIEASLRKMQSKESVVGVVAGAWEPRPLQHSWEYQMSKPKKQQQQQPSSPALSKSVPSSPAGRVRNLPLPLPQVNVHAIAKGNGVGKSASAQDVLGGSLSAATGRKLAARVVAWEAGTNGDTLERHEKTTAAGRTGLRARANTSGDLLLLADGTRRPALHKSASASVLGPSGVQRTPLGQGHRRTPVPIHTGITLYHGSSTLVVDDSLPPTPSSLASTEIEEDYDDEEEEDYGVEVNERSRALREQEHEERWTRLKMANDAVTEGYRPYQQQALPPIPQSPPPPSLIHSSSAALIESTLKALSPSPSTTSLAAQQGLQPMSPDTRQRLKSMPSLTLASARQAAAAGTTSPLASTSTTNFSHAPSIMSARSGKGFRGFVERMGFVGSSANGINSNSNSPSSSYPGTPLYAVTPVSAVPLQLSIPGSGATVLGQFAPSPSAAPNNSRSPSHSPTASLSLGGAHKEGSVFTPGGLLGKKKPKRKLIISGVAPENVRGYEAVKKWCEAFGEVREMTRAPNGKLYVDFKKASVAETVCRIQAQVFIKGAGSVSLSWYTKKKPI